MKHNIIDLPIKCSECQGYIEEEDIYLCLPNCGIICENCPEFGDLGISVDIEERLL